MQWEWTFEVGNSWGLCGPQILEGPWELRILFTCMIQLSGARTWVASCEDSQVDITMVTVCYCWRTAAAWCLIYRKFFLYVECFCEIFLYQTSPSPLPYIFIGMLFLLSNLTLPCHSSSFLSFVSFCLTLFAFGPLQLPTHSLGSPQLLQNWINHGSQELSSVCYSTLLVLLPFSLFSLLFCSYFFLVFNLLFFFHLNRRALKYLKVEPLATNLKFLVNKCWICVIIIDG